jgi:hypothetical protein
MYCKTTPFFKKVHQFLGNQLMAEVQKRFYSKNSSHVNFSKKFMSTNGDLKG